MSVALLYAFAKAGQQGDEAERRDKCGTVPPRAGQLAGMELHGAATRGDVQAVQKLLTPSVNINSRTEDVSSIVFIAATYAKSSP